MGAEPQETRSVPRNRKCGNCRYFEPAPLWRKGWCRNPQLYPPHANHLVDSATIDCEGGFRSRIYWEPLPNERADEAITDKIPVVDIQQARYNAAKTPPIRPMGANFKPHAYQPEEEAPVYDAPSFYIESEVIPPETTPISQETPLPVEQLIPIKDETGWRAEVRKRLPFTNNWPLEKIEPKVMLPWLLVGLLFIIMLFVVLGNNAKKSSEQAADAARDNAIATQNAILVSARPVTNTPSAQATTPPAANAPVSKTATVNGVGSDGLRLRKDPSTSAQTITTLKEGAKVTVLEGPRSADGLEWYKVDFGGQVGWTVKKYLVFT